MCAYVIFEQCYYINNHAQPKTDANLNSNLIMTQSSCIFKSTVPRAPDKDRFLFSRMPVSSPNPIFDHWLESSHRDDSNKWSNIGFGEEIREVESIEVNFMNLIWSPDCTVTFNI